VSQNGSFPNEHQSEAGASRSFNEQKPARRASQVPVETIIASTA
jgi:hypothetical protein